MCTDASLKGAVLLGGHSVYFMTKSLQPHQNAYVAIELDSFTVTWAMQKFHHFFIQLETEKSQLKLCFPVV